MDMCGLSVGRRRAQEALRKAQQDAAREKLEKEKKSSSKRTGGGFVITYDRLG